MKFIENFELREWVKDSLRKAIFQKAHALAVQTGCEVLFKVHDNQDITGCQYYATTNLKRMYRNSKLRQAGETQVSGETGLPLMDKCIQYGEDASASTESSIPNDDGGGGDGDMQGAFQEQPIGANAVPMQLSSASGFSDFNSQTQQQQTQGDDGNADSDIEITDITNPQNLLAAAAQVKQEPGMGMFQQQNTMYGQQQQQQQQQGMMGNQQGIMGNQMMGAGDPSMVQPGYQVPIAPKPYQCSICRKAFKSVHVLQKHTLTFHTPGGAGGSRRGRGSRGSRGGRGRGSRGRGLKLTISRTQLAGGHQQQYQAMPTVKTEAGASGGSEQNGTTCTYCNQTFEQPEQLSAHIPECPIAQQQQQQQQDQFADGAVAAAAGSLDQSGFPTDFPSASTDDPSTSQADWQQQFMPPDGSSPSGLNLPSASSFFGQQNLPTSMYSTPSQSPRASTSGGGSSGGSRRKGSKSAGRRLLSDNATMSRRSIMAAILQTAGPCLNWRTVKHNWTFLRMLTVGQYVAAANELQNLQLGALVMVINKTNGKGSKVFVKRRPGEVVAILEANPDLCAPDYFELRYELPMSKYVPEHIAESLAEMQLV